MDGATRAVGRVSWADWKDVGGVESIEECVFSSSIIVLASRILTGYRTGYLGGKNAPYPFFFFDPDCSMIHALYERKENRVRRWMSYLAYGNKI
jgi:hypothetical protein